MKNLVIDGAQFDSITTFYTHILSLFPEKKEYFGANLDALYDILSDESYETILVKEYPKIRFDLGDEFFVGLEEILFDLDVKKSLTFEA